MRKAVDDSLRAEYREAMSHAWKSPSMVDYCTNKADVIVRLSDGRLVGIDKPSIETSFCFDDSYDYEGACKMAEHASKSENYFLRENLKGLDETIRVFETRKWHDSDYSPSAVFYAITNYCGDEVGKVASVNYCCEGDVGERVRPNDYSRFTVLGDADIEAMLAGYKLVRERFEKRLHTYLKRYGMSKVRTWTYWGEA